MPNKLKKKNVIFWNGCTILYRYMFFGDMGFIWDHVSPFLFDIHIYNVIEEMYWNINRTNNKI